MKTIFITISRGSLIRNFFHTGVVPRLLEAGHKVIVLSPFYDHKEYFSEFQHKDLVFEPLHKPKWWIGNVVAQELLRNAVLNETIIARYKYQIAVPVPPAWWLYHIRVYLLGPLRFVLGYKTFARWVDMTLNPEREHDYLFEKYKPDLVFATSPKDESDSGVMKSAKRYGVKLVCMPKSWDNLSNVLFSVKANTLIVWNTFMKDQAVRLHGFDPKDIVMTGAPQFDYYLKKEKLMSREAFCAQFDFDPKKKIILYGSSGADVCDEPSYVRTLERFMKNGDLKNVQMLIRPHTGYKGDAERYDVTSDPNIVVDRTDKQDHRFKDHWDPRENHLIHMFNSLHHADVMVNVGSTFTIDSVVNDTPAINIKYDTDPNVDPLSRSTLRLFHSDYLKALMATGATYIVESESELLDALKAVLERGERKEEGMKRLVDDFAYRRDGKAAERIANVLLECLDDDNE